MRRAILALLLLLSSSVFATEINEDAVGRAFARYIEALRIADYQTALEFWSLYDRTLTDQLKLQYPDAPVKLEVGSPIWNNIEAIRAGQMRLDVTGIELNRGFAKIDYVMTGADSILGVAYMDIESHQEPHLITPLQVFAEHWDHTTSDYFEVISRDPSLLEESNLALADEYLKNTAERLGLSREKLIVLETFYVRTYLCQSFGEIEQLTSNGELGAVYLPADAIVSRFCPDRNQIAQFLVEYAIDDLPSQTLPLFKFGTATFLGGHHGRSRDVSLSLGKYIFKNGFTKLEDLMTVAGFSAMEDNPDFSYPVAALFCSYLYDMMGRGQFLGLYRQMSGTMAQIKAISVEDCRSAVSQTLGVEWPEIESSFAAYVDSYSYTAAQPGGSDQGKLVLQSGIPGVLVQISSDDTYLNFLIKADSTQYSAAVLSKRVGENSSYRSFLFNEHFPEMEYDRRHFGVIFTPSEVGCYDYFTNEIIAKYIVGFTADDALTTGAKGEYRFRILKELMPGFADELLEVHPAN